MVESEEINDMPLKEKFHKIAEEIRISWIRDCDKTNYMILLIDLLKEMQKKESLEEYFSNNEEDLNYFMGDCMNEIINNILIQPIIYGEKGDEIGLELLLNIYKLFLKFHKNKKYAPLFEKIRTIFHYDRGSCSFFSSNDPRNNNPIKKYDCNKFNSIYNSEFAKNGLKNKFKKDDEVDIVVENDTPKTEFERKIWVRGKIKEIKDDEYLVEYGGENGEINIPINDSNICPVGEKTVDWDWRTNLKKYDLVDCFDRGKWYPSTIVNSSENEINGFKIVKYKVGFRLYPEHYKNPEDENDTYDKHLDIWKQGNLSENPDTDSEQENYFGDKEGYDEIIPHYSKRIQKFNTYSKCQQKNLNFIYNGNNYFYNNNDDNNPMKLMNEQLGNDTEISVEDYYNYEVKGKKNVIIRKNKEFLSYFGIFLKKN